MVTYGADMVILGIYMGIVFMTCTVVILTTIYVLKQGLGKTNPWTWKQLWTWKKHKLPEEAPVATAAEPVPVNETIEEPVHPPDLEKDGNTPIVTPTSPEVSPVSAAPPIEGEQASISSPDTSSPEPEPASHQEPTVSEAEPKQSEPANAEPVQSEGVPVTEPDRNNQTESPNQVVQYSQSGQEEAAELKANEAIPDQTSEPAPHQEPTVSEAEPEQPEPANTEPVQSEPVQPEMQTEETPPEKAEGKEPLGDLNDLFSEEIVEESDSSKLASSLNEVDVFHLAADARSLLDNMKKSDSDDST